MKRGDIVTVAVQTTQFTSPAAVTSQSSPAGGASDEAMPAEGFLDTGVKRAPAEKINLCAGALAEVSPSIYGLQLDVTFPPTAPVGTDPITGTVCPAPPGGGRGVYDNVCDYKGLSDVGAKDQSGAAPSGLDLSAYTVTVNVDESASLNNLSGSGQVLRVNVNVIHGTGSLVNITLSGFRANY